MATKVTDLNPGQRIRLNYGCMHGSEDATVVGVDSNRFGYFAQLMTDDEVPHQIHGEETVQGIGWTLITQVAA